MGVANHLIYVLFSIAFTVYVGQSLYRLGLPFLVECWGHVQVATAVNRFFLVGFYLLNLAFVLLALKYGKTGFSFEDSLEILARRIGFIVLVMGVMHFNNLFWCELIRHRRNHKLRQQGTQQRERFFAERL
jgi:hypothetical protein